MAHVCNCVLGGMRGGGCCSTPPVAQYHGCHHCYCQTVLINGVSHSMCCNCGHRQRVQPPFGGTVTTGSALGTITITNNTTDFNADTL